MLSIEPGPQIQYESIRPSAFARPAPVLLLILHHSAFCSLLSRISRQAAKFRSIQSFFRPQVDLYHASDIQCRMFRHRTFSCTNPQSTAPVCFLDVSSAFYRTEELNSVVAVITSVITFLRPSLGPRKLVVSALATLLTPTPTRPCTADCVYMAICTRSPLLCILWRLVTVSYYLPLYL